MRTIQINTEEGSRNYVQVSERILDLKRSGVDYEIQTTGTYFPVDRIFVAHARLIVHNGPKTVREYHGLCNKKLGDSGYDASALSWAETIAIGRAYAKAFPDKLVDAGAELITPEEIEIVKDAPEVNSVPPIVQQTLDTLKKKRNVRR